MGTMKIGWAEESLVPDQKVSLGGQFFERISHIEGSAVVLIMLVSSPRGFVITTLFLRGEFSGRQILS